MTTQTLAPTYDFRGHPVRKLEHRGALAFIAREVGAALGYEREGKRFVSLLTAEWSVEIQEGVHWYRVKGVELRQLKAQVRAREGMEPVASGGGEARGGALAEPPRGEVSEGSPASEPPRAIATAARGGALAEPPRGEVSEGGPASEPPGAIATTAGGGALAEPPRGELSEGGPGSEPPAALARTGGGALAEPRSLVGAVGSRTPPRPFDVTFASELVVLTEEGLTLALMRSGQRIAVEFRKWLACEVVPQIARTGRYDPLARLRAVRPSPDMAALIRIVGVAMAAGRLDVAADLLDAGRRLAASPGERLLPPPARLRASNRLLVRLIHRGVLKGPHLALLLHQPAWRPAEKAVLGLLLMTGGEARRVELSYRDIAERLNLSRRTVLDAVRILEKARVVTCRRGRGGRDPEPNVYVVDFEALEEWNDKKRPEAWGEAKTEAPR